jgi:hypothetical protein
MNRLNWNIPGGKPIQWANFGAINGTTGGGERLSWILYIFIGLFMTAVIVMVVQPKIDWSFLDPRPRRIKVSSRAYKAWENEYTYTNLQYTGPTEFDSHNYTVQFDCILYNTRNYLTTEGPYRHILHRGSKELMTTNPGGIPLSGCAPAGVGELPPFGLPSRMNPGIFIDPNINDVIIFVDTMNGATPYRESVRIVDIPLDIPFNISVIIHGQVLEVYLNCKLEVTKVLSGVPREIENDWYGISGRANAQAQVQNMMLWTNPLSAEDIRSLCTKLPQFKGKRPLCEGTNTSQQPVSTDKAKVSATKDISLSLGASIKATCNSLPNAPQI